MTLEKVIEKIIKERENECLFPYVAPLNEVKKECGLPNEEFWAEVEELKNKGRIKNIRTINSYAFELI